MKPPRFAYHDPQTVPEVVSLLGKLENARLLAGGQSLMPLLNMRLTAPEHIVDLNRVAALSYIKEEGEALVIGAMTRQRDIEFDARIGERCPLLHEAVLQVGHRQTRNRGTLGGSLCQLDPSAELVAVAAALDAVVTVEGPNGARDIAFAEFPAGLMTPALREGELLTSARFALWRKGHGFAFVEFSRRHGDFAIVSAAALLMEDGAGKITRASLTLGGIAPAPVRARDVEKMLTGARASAELFREAGEACRKLEVMEDVHVTAAYRHQLAAVLSRRALEKAHERVARN
ncbi:MAG TPA: xanthine dehydrogenase family protein subunit M [Burkholderiales bacterium]|nr:xanthine dehydrogenase family protein subunit M [Burkholderiales bacterium]